MTAEERSAPPRLQAIILWGGWLIFCLLVIANVIHHPLSDTMTMNDEQGHLSYGLYLIDHHRLWPDFDHFPMYHTVTYKPLIATNYINHPPTFYWLMPALHALMPSLTAPDYRIMVLLIELSAMALYTRIAQQLALPVAGAGLYAVLPLLVYAHMQVGFISNDAAALAGGMIASYASLRWFAQHRPQQAYGFMLLGVAIASVKLTSFLLVGSFVSACFLIGRPARHTLTWQYWFGGAVLAVVLAIPYLILNVQEGSPAPETLGQRLLMGHAGPGTWSRLPMVGWVETPRMDFIHWLATFLRNFVIQISAYDTSIIGVFFVLLGFVMVLRTLFRTRALPSQPMACMVLASLLATVPVFLIHMVFSWGRYVHYGWLLDSGLRYYLPILAPYGIAAAYAVQCMLRPTKETV